MAALAGEMVFKLILVLAIILGIGTTLAAVVSAEDVGLRLVFTLLTIACSVISLICLATLVIAVCYIVGLIFAGLGRKELKRTRTVHVGIGIALVAIGHPLDLVFSLIPGVGAIPSILTSAAKAVGLFIIVYDVAKTIGMKRWLYSALGLAIGAAVVSAVVKTAVFAGLFFLAPLLLAAPLISLASKMIYLVVYYRAYQELEQRWRLLKRRGSRKRYRPKDMSRRPGSLPEAIVDVDEDGNPIQPGKKRRRDPKE
jgi:hypothetical protein